MAQNHLNFICPTCEGCMNLDLSGQQVEYKCPKCGTEKEGDLYDANLSSSDKDYSNTIHNELYRRLLKNVANDPVNKKMSVNCPQCSIPYMTLTRLGDHETASLWCTCGFNTKAGPLMGGGAQSGDQREVEQY